MSHKFHDKVSTSRLMSRRRCLPYSVATPVDDGDGVGVVWMQASGAGPRCVFRELHSVDHYTQFQSVADERWFVGFNRRGGRLLADSTSPRRRRRRRRRRCFQFVKSAVDAVPGPPTVSYERLYSVLHPSHVTSEDPT